MKQFFYYLITIALLLSANQTYSLTPNAVVATIPVGVTPASLAVTHDSRLAYVANNNNYGFPGSDNVTVLDLTNNTVVTTINDPSFMEPWRIAINASNTRAYVCNSSGTTVSIIDIPTNTVIGTITGFDGPSGIVITPDGLHAYVNNYGTMGGGGNGTTVNVVDLVTNMIVGAPITVGLAPAALAITPNGAFVYTVNYEDGDPGTGTMSIIRTSDNTVVGTIFGFSGPFGIAITPDGTRAYVTNFGSNDFFPYGTTVSVIDLSSNTVIDTINVGIQPAGIGITPDGRYAYVSNYNTLYASGPNPPFKDLTPGQGTLDIIDIASNTVIPPFIAVDESPDAVVIAPNGAFAYVTNYTANTVNVIALQAFILAAQGCKTENIFLTQTDLINKLTVTATGTILPVSYSIYRNAALTDLVATVPATNPLVFLDHNRRPNVTYTYYIVGTDTFGISSNPVAVTVTQNC